MGDETQTSRTGRSPASWVIPIVVVVIVVSGLAWGLRFLGRATDDEDAGSAAPGPGAGAPSEASVPPDVPDDWRGPHGRWHIGDWREGPSGEEPELTAEQEAEIERLQSIGYLAGSQPAPARSGVTVYDRRRALDGLNFYTTGDVPGAVLMDMEGHVLHKWAHGYIEAWTASPDRPELRASPKGSGFWRRAHLFDNGDVIAVFDGLAILKVDRDSRLLWVTFGGFHHDLDVMDDGTIYVLTREAHIVPSYNPDEPILEDFVAVLDSAGREISRVSILDALANSEFAPILATAEPSGDIFHCNTVEVLDGRLEREIPAFRAGNVLVTVRELDLVIVVDMEAVRVVWALTGSWEAPHQATVLKNGHMMIFDNRGNEGASRVIEFDPVTLETMWVYKGARPADFRSRECGSAHRLSNGNTLIVETDRGKAFEVTPDGEVVWKFVNPAQTGEHHEYIASLFDVERLPPTFPTGWARWRPSAGP
jgi:outer membrane protein assembly factor BamB